MSISVGDRLPEATFRVLGADGIEKLTTDEVFAGKKVVLFAVPGAFTPTCHLKHLPGFLDNADAFKKKGVHTVACVAVNDPFVMDAWAKATGGKGKVLFLSDGNGEFTKAIGLDFDGSGIGLGTRSKRYAMLVDDGVVTVLNVEEFAGVADVSTAEKLLAKVCSAAGSDYGSARRPPHEWWARFALPTLRARAMPAFRCIVDVKDGGTSLALTECANSNNGGPR